MPCLVLDNLGFVVSVLILHMVNACWIELRFFGSVIGGVEVSF